MNVGWKELRRGSASSEREGIVKYLEWAKNYKPELEEISSFPGIEIIGVLMGVIVLLGVFWAVFEYTSPPPEVSEGQETSPETGAVPAPEPVSVKAREWQLYQQLMA